MRQHSCARALAALTMVTMVSFVNERSMARIDPPICVWACVIPLTNDAVPATTLLAPDPSRRPETCADDSDGKDGLRGGRPSPAPAGPPVSGPAGGQLYCCP